ncbi:F-box protein [Glycine soja]|uniref:F-box protein n=1 Tax=Glycine soja TaxID=3848 RepID=A0A0B2RP31_GLYSO|nr:F-box protein [Glycine soja]
MCSDARVSKKKNKDLHMHMHMHMHVPAGDSIIYSRKRQKKTPEKTAGADYEFFESLPDDLVISIFCKLSSTATKPSDFVNILITCKRLNRLALHSLVLSKASPKTFTIKARDWCDSAHKFLKHCADAGNVEACYTLGMRLIGSSGTRRNVLPAPVERWLDEDGEDVGNDDGDGEVEVMVDS